MRDSPPSSDALARLLAAPVAALAAAVCTFFLLFFLLMPLQRFDSEPVAFHGLRLVVSFGEGFAFLFAGSVVAGRRWPIITALYLAVVGIVCFTYLHTQYSSDGFPVWHLVTSIAGGLCAVGLRAIKRHKRAA